MKAIDIETIPNMDMVDYLPEPEVAIGNLKDPVKISEKTQEAKKKQIEKMGLDPFFGRICSYAQFGETGDNHFKTIGDATDAEEIELIGHIFKCLSSNLYDSVESIITWNGFSFDLPYIFKRAAILRVEKPVSCQGLKFWNKKYSSSVHIDLMRELSNWEPHGINLNTAGKLLLGKGKTERDYSTYYDLIKSGKGNLIGLDNLCDVELTYRIYEMVKGYIF